MRWRTEIKEFFCKTLHVFCRNSCRGKDISLPKVFGHWREEQCGVSALLAKLDMKSLELKLKGKSIKNMMCVFKCIVFRKRKFRKRIGAKEEKPAVRYPKQFWMKLLLRRSRDTHRRPDINHCCSSKNQGNIFQTSLFRKLNVSENQCVKKVAVYLNL